MESNSKYSYSKLKERMREYRYSQNRLAQEVCMSRNSLNLKLNNRSIFTQNDMEQICKVLEIPISKVGLYFFN